MPWKLGEDGKVVTQDGKPVYVHADGKEVPFDGEQALGKIQTLQREAQQYREAREAADAAIAPYKALGEPDALKAAVETAEKLKGKKLLDAGEVETLRAEYQRKLDEGIKAAKVEADKLRADLENEAIGGRFGNSKFVQDRCYLPPDMLRTTFGVHFKVEDGKVIGYDRLGNKITSRERFGEPADFDEALEQLVGAHPHRDKILKAPTSAGSGAATSPQNGGVPANQAAAIAAAAARPVDKTTIHDLTADLTAAFASGAGRISPVPPPMSPPGQGAPAR
jgi:hypothetical protein